MSEKTNAFIKKIADQKGFKQIYIAARLAEMKGETAENYKGIVHKWFKTNQEPGKDYLLGLAKILGVSVESILSGEYVPVQDLRATAYSAALSGDKEIITRLFNNIENPEIDVTTVDEYGKSFIDYVLEFDNYKALKTAIDSGFCPISQCSIMNLTSNNREKAISLLDMIIRADDLEVFKTAYSRITPIISSTSLNPGSFVNQIPYEVIDSILDSKAILHYFIDQSPLTKEEDEALNGIVYRIHENPLDHMDSLTPCFNTLLRRVMEANDEKRVNMLLDLASNYIDSIKDICNPVLRELCIDFEGALTFKGSRAILAFVPYMGDFPDLSNYPKAKAITDFTNCFQCII